MADNQNRNILDNAGVIWKFLDELSLKDPLKYQEFTKRVIEEGSKDQKPPTPKFSIKTAKTPAVIPVIDYYINFIEWQVPEHGKSDSSSPLFLSQWRKEISTKGQALVIDIAFNSNSYKQFAYDKQELINFAYTVIEKQHGFSLSRSYEILQENYVGCLDNLYNFMCPELHNAAFNAVSSKEASIISKSSADQNFELVNESLLGGRYQGGVTTALNCSEKTLLTEVATRRLITEERHFSAAASPPFEMIVDRVKCTVQWNIALEGVASVQECQLNISKNSLLLTVGDKYYLKLDLPFSLDEESVEAKYTKKSSSLVVTSRLEL